MLILSINLPSLVPIIYIQPTFLSTTTMTREVTFYTLIHIRTMEKLKTKTVLCLNYTFFLFPWKIYSLRVLAVATVPRHFSLSCTRVRRTLIFPLLADPLQPLQNPSLSGSVQRSFTLWFPFENCSQRIIFYPSQHMT